MFCTITRFPRALRRRSAALEDCPSLCRSLARWLAQNLARVFCSWGLFLTPALAETPPLPRCGRARHPPGVPRTGSCQHQRPLPRRRRLRHRRSSNLSHGCTVAGTARSTAANFARSGFRLRGDMMVGLSQTVMEGKIRTSSMSGSSRGPTASSTLRPFGQEGDGISICRQDTGRRHDVFTFENPAATSFRSSIVYRHGTEGWLYASAEGQLNGSSAKVIYPMRRVDCASGELIKSTSDAPRSEASAVLRALKSCSHAGKDNALAAVRAGIRVSAHRRRRDRRCVHLQRAVVFDPAYSAAWKMLGKALLKRAQRRGLERVSERDCRRRKKGDKQAMKEMQVFARRLAKAPARE